MRIKLKLIVIACMMILAFACGVNSPFLDQAGDMVESGGAGLRLKFDRGRTVLPDYLDSIFELHIELLNLETEETEPYTLDGSNDYIIEGLEPGMYSLSAEAFNSLEQLVLSGTTEPFEIEIVGLVDVHLPLVYNNPESGQGGIDISWSFRPPEGSFEPVELTMILVDVLADEWDGDGPEPYEFYFNVPFEDLDNEWQQGYFSWTAGSTRAVNKLDRASLHLTADDIPAGHYHVAFMLGTELQWDGGMGGAHSIQAPEIGEPLAVISNGYYGNVIGPMLMWLDTIRVEDGLVSKARFDFSSRHFGPLPTDVTSLSTYLDWVGTSGVLEYGLRFQPHENTIAYRIEELVDDEWVMHTSISSPSYSWIMAGLWSETRFRMRPENFVGPGSWIEFTVDGDPQSPRMQVLRTDSSPPESWALDFDLAPFSSSWFGITDGSGELYSSPLDLYVYDTALSGQILIDAAVDSYARLWAISGDSGAYRLEMVRNLKDGDPLSYNSDSVFLEYPDLMIDSVSSLAVDPEGEWLLAFGQSSEGIFALGASTYVGSPGGWGWEQHYIDLESEIINAVTANTGISEPAGLQIIGSEIFRNELYLVIAVENEPVFMKFDLGGMPEELSLSTYINLHELAPYGYYLESFGTANHEPILLYRGGEYPAVEYVMMRLDAGAEVLVQESAFSTTSSFMTAGIARGTAAKGHRLIMLDDGTDYFFYRINEDFSIDFFWDELAVELVYPEWQ